LCARRGAREERRPTAKWYASQSIGGATTGNTLAAGSGSLTKFHDREREEIEKDFAALDIMSGAR
jgi:hypothetical protein